MSTAILTPWYRRLSHRSGATGDCTGATRPTRILDHRSDDIAQLVDEARATAPDTDPLSVLQAAHGLIRDRVRPVYALEEATPTSVTLERGFGSCSQRLAILESVARSIGVPTRVRALLIDRSFWYPRFPRFKRAMPHRIMLAWPEFQLGTWKSASELFGSTSCAVGGAFTNTGSETLFEAVGRCAVDWDGYTRNGDADLSRFVHADLGYFADRDELFGTLGQTLCTFSRAVADPIMRRIAA